MEKIAFKLAFQIVKKNLICPRDREGSNSLPLHSPPPRIRHCFLVDETTSRQSSMRMILLYVALTLRALHCIIPLMIYLIYIKGLGDNIFLLDRTLISYVIFEIKTNLLFCNIDCYLTTYSSIFRLRLGLN